jgi:hypothetical protein
MHVQTKPRDCASCKYLPAVGLGAFDVSFCMHVILPLFLLLHCTTPADDSQSVMGTIRGELDVMVGGAALWARVGALVLSIVQLVMLYACGFSGASFGQVFLQPRAAAVLTQHLIDEEQVPTKAGWGAIVGDVRRVAGGHGGARPPSMRQSVFAKSKPIKEREDKFKQVMTGQAVRAYWDEQLIDRRAQQLRQGVRFATPALHVRALAGLTHSM